MRPSDSRTATGPLLTGAGPSTLRRRLVRLAHIAGYLVVALSLVFLADRFIEAGVWDLARSRGPALLGGIAIAAIFYGLCSFMMSVAWVWIVRWCGQPDAPFGLGLGIYGRTQIAKYIPGNVFHFVGRHVAGRRSGFDHVPMVWAALVEAAGMVSVAAGIAVVGTVLRLPLAVGVSSVALAAIAMLALVSPIVLSRAFVWLGRLLDIPVQGRRALDIVTGLLPAYGLYALFFTASAAILWCLSLIIADPPISVLPVLVPTLTAAWLAGYLTPGAAAGLGVREAVITAALSNQLGAADAALLAVSYRGVTLLGDAVFFALSTALTSPARPIADSPARPK